MCFNFYINDIFNYFVGKKSIQRKIIEINDRFVSDAEEYDIIPKCGETCIYDPGSKKTEDNGDYYVEILKKEGFVKSKSVVEHENSVRKVKEERRLDDLHVRELKRSYDAVKVVSAARKIYSKHALYLPFDLFTKVISEYGFECRPFPEYTGHVSKNMMQLLHDLKEKDRYDSTMIRQVYPVKSIEKIYVFIGKEEYDNIMERLRYFPFVLDIGKTPHRYDRHQVVTYADNSRARIDNNYIHLYDVTSFFLVAPKNAFDGEPIEVDDDDLLICGFTGDGVLIFHNWEMSKKRRLKNDLDKFSLRLRMFGF